MNALNVGCGTHYAEGWVNTDVWVSDTTRPDVQVDPDGRYPFPDATFDALYLGHVLEHMEWSNIPGFLDEMERLAAPRAWMLVVGPDVFRTIRRWRAGKEPWEMVAMTMEHADMNYQPDRETEEWQGSHHYWNCHADRLGKLLSGWDAEDISDDIPDNFTESDPACRRWWDDPVSGVRWPVVDKAPWQCGFRVRMP